MLATQYTTGGGGGGSDTALLVIVVLLLAGYLLYRLVRPVIKLVLESVEKAAALSFKAGRYLVYAGVATVVLAVGYVMLAT